MMLNKEDLKYKEYIKLEKMLNVLRDKLSNLPNVKLDKPYQSGWIIFYDLRADIKKRIDYPVIKSCIDIGYRNSFTKNVNVVRAIRQNDNKAVVKNRFGGMTIISDHYPKRTDITEGNYLKLDIKANKFFALNDHSEKYRRFQRKEYFCDLPSYWLVLKVKPNMITHRYLKGGDIESEYECLKQRLFWSGEFNSFATNYGGSYPRTNGRAKVRDKIRKYVNGEADDIFNDKTPLEYEY